MRGELDFVTFFVQGDLIENSLAQLRETALWGGLLAVGVLLVFLRRLRLTVCVALSIPVAALMALACEYFAGGSFNVLTMTGITLAIGMLVDNAVVVVENIARLKAEGHRNVDAARLGGRQIALAVTLATATTIVVFLPLIFMGENPMVRVIFGGIGIPLCTALAFSLFIALVFLPVATARLLGRDVEEKERAPAPPRFGALLALPHRAFGLAVGAVRVAWHGVVVALFWLNRAAIAPLAFPVRVGLAVGVLALAAWVGQRSRSAMEAAGAGGKEIAFLGGWLGVLTTIALVMLLWRVPAWRRRPTRPPARPAHWIPRQATVLQMIVASNQRLVGWTLANRGKATLASLLAFSSILIPMKLVDPAAFMAGDGDPELDFRVRFDTEFTLAEAAEELRPYEEVVETHREEWGYEHWRSRFDEDSGSFELSWSEPPPPETFERIRSELKEKLPEIAGHSIRFYDEENVAENSREICRFQIRGPDSIALERIGEEAAVILEGVDGLSEVSTQVDDAPEQLDVQIDRDLALQMGVRSDSALQTISWALRGFMLPRFHEEGREIPLIIEYDEEETAGIQTLRDLPISTGETRVPLSSFAKVSTTKGSRSIFRENGKTTFELFARVDDPARRQEIETRAWGALAAGLELPRGFALGIDQSARSRQQEEFSELRRALFLSLVLVVLLMAILFESYVLPLAVVFTVPFSMLGAMWTIYVTGTPLDFLGWIGLIILAGVVVNNGIVLVDRIHGLVLEREDRTSAVLDACAQRVRPILMTALTTVVGLLPMAIAAPATNAIPYRSLAAVVAGGLIVSTFFTLWVVPLAYTLLDDTRKAVALRVRWAWRGMQPDDAPLPDLTSGIPTAGPK